MAPNSLRRPQDRLVLPLDVPDLDSAAQWVRQLQDEVGVFKVGLELFTAAGTDSVRMVHDAGAACFLDLKLHDIPATMEHAVHAAAGLGVKYLTVHSSAGRAALERSAKAAAGTGINLLAVTVLTSLDAGELEEVGLQQSTTALVTRRARLAADSGIGGVVCSPMECRELRKSLGPDLTLVVPGIRPAGSDHGDQRRVATPTDAIRQGADLLVVGRPIRNAPDPVVAARAIVQEIADATP